MTTTAVRPDGAPAPSPRPAWRDRRFWARVQVLLPALLVVALGAAGWRFLTPHATAAPYVVPQSPQLEQTYGIRFNQVDIVGDGGLVELGYTVLDGEKATQFQSDTHHPPLLRNEGSNATVTISALMKQGHNLRPGQTYFVIYENPHNSIRPGELVTIEYQGRRLEHVPTR